MRRVLAWPLPLAAVWLCLPVLGAVIAATIEPIPPHDYWWHIAMGRVMAATGGLVETNLFLYTLPADAPFVDQPWLAQLMMWGVFDVFGHAGGVWLRNLLLAVSIGLLTVTSFRRSGDARVSGALMLVAVMLAYPVLTVRTRMFAFVPFALVVWASLGVADGALRRRWLAVVPVATAFWANVHGTFILGPAVVGAAGVGLVARSLLERRTVDRDEFLTWAAAIVATIFAGALNPHGPDAYRYVFDLAVTSPVHSSVSEWLPPRVTEPTGALFAGAAAASIVVLAMRRRSVRLYEILLFAGTFYLSAGAVRSMYWWAGALPVVVAPHLAALIPASNPQVEPASRASGLLNAAILAGALLLAVAVQPGVLRDEIGEAVASGQARRAGTGRFVLNHENPLGLVKRIRADGRRRVFHDQALGGLLEVALTEGAEPTQVAYVDQRMEFIPEPIWVSFFAASAAVGHEELLARHEVDTLLLSPDSQWPLLQSALASPRWELVAVEQSHVLLYRVPSLDGAQDPAEQEKAQNEEGNVHRADDADEIPGAVELPVDD